MLHSRVARLLTFPIVSFGLFVASPFALYFSGLYRLSLENEWIHELVHLHFMVVGCLFFWPLIGLDPLPGRLPYPLRALMMFLSTPFHTVLGLTVMQSTDLLGGDWYPSLRARLGRPGHRPAARRRDPVGGRRVRRGGHAGGAGRAVDAGRGAGGAADRPGPGPRGGEGAGRPGPAAG